MHEIGTGIPVLHRFQLRCHSWIADNCVFVTLLPVVSLRQRQFDQRMGSPSSLSQHPDEQGFPCPES